MNPLSLIVSAASWLPLLARFAPQIAPLVPIAQQAATGIEAAAPALQAAAPALKQAAEQFVPLVKSVFALVQTHVDSGMSHETAIATATDRIRELHGMTPEAEQRWFDQASGGPGF